LCEDHSQNVANSQGETEAEKIERGEIVNIPDVGVSHSYIQEMLKAVLEGVKRANAELNEGLQNNI
jgi:hypothetical protein